MLFLAWAGTGTPKETIDRKIRFTLARDLFEEVWMEGKEWIFKAFGRKGAGPSRLTRKHIETLDLLISRILSAKENSTSAIDVLNQFLLELDPKIHADFLKQYEKEKGRPAGRFSGSTKLQAEFYAVFRNGTSRCSLCGGRLLLGSHQIDHIEPRRKGGKSSVSNAEPKHPFCNNQRTKLETFQQFLSGEESSYNVTTALLPRPCTDPQELDTKRVKLSQCADTSASHATWLSHRDWNSTGVR